jgi:hypothetical protein
MLRVTPSERGCDQFLEGAVMKVGLRSSFRYHWTGFINSSRGSKPCVSGFGFFHGIETTLTTGRASELLMSVFGGCGPLSFDMKKIKIRPCWWDAAAEREGKPEARIVAGRCSLTL